MEPKSDQNASKNQASEKVAKRIEKEGPPRLSAGPYWEPFLIKNRKNCIQKGIQKSMSKKYRKMMPKGSQNDAKMDAKFNDVLIFCEFVIF